MGRAKAGGIGRGGFVSASALRFPIPHSRFPARSADDRQHVVFFQNLVLDAVLLVGAARVLAVDDLVADLELRRAQAAVVQGLAFADGDDFTLGRLFLGGVGDDDAAGG